jgi:hypothetical protein
MISLIRKLIIWISDWGLLNRCVNGSCCSLIFSFYEVFCRSLSSSCVLCVRSCQCFWIVHSWLPLRFSLTFSPMPYILIIRYNHYHIYSEVLNLISIWLTFLLMISSLTSLNTSAITSRVLMVVSFLPQTWQSLFLICFTHIITQNKYKKRIYSSFTLLITIAWMILKKNIFINIDNYYICTTQWSAVVVLLHFTLQILIYVLFSIIDLHPVTLARMSLYNFQVTISEYFCTWDFTYS